MSIYEYKGELYFIGHRTKKMVKIIELYNPTSEGYCCKDGLRHPAAGHLVSPKSLRLLKPHEITKDMRLQLSKRRKQIRGF
jgi:hypothetical protein